MQNYFSPKDTLYTSLETYDHGVQGVLMVGDCLLGNPIQPKHPLCATSAYLFMHSPLLCMHLNRRERERERYHATSRIIPLIVFSFFFIV